MLGKALPPEIQISISLGIIIAMLSIAQQYLNDMIKGGSTRAFDNQANANHYLIDYINKYKVREAKLIEYDGDSVKQLMEVLLQHKVRLHVLLQHPEHACSGFQANRILHKIRVREEEFGEYGDRITFSYYKDTASIRGRGFDNKLISIGWYTYDRRGQSGIGGEPQVWGHNNPVLVIRDDSDEFRHISVFFFRKGISKSLEQFRNVRRIKAAL